MCKNKTQKQQNQILICVRQSSRIENKGGMESEKVREARCARMLKQTGRKRSNRSILLGGGMNIPEQEKLTHDVRMS